LGIYTYLEDRWYDLVDWLNQYVPVANVIDSVDRVIPSFILFLAILILLLIGVFVFVFSSGGGISGSQFLAEVTVLSNKDSPIPGAIVSFGQACSTLAEDIVLKTDSEGKAVFRACSDSADIRASKEGYSTSSQTVSFEDNKAKIRLSPLSSSSRIINVKVKDAARKIIENVEVYLLCSKGGVLDENLVGNKNQLTFGFSVTIPSGCDSIQLRAVADGYSEKKELVGLAEENKTIYLDEIDNSGSVAFEVNSTAGKREAIISITDELGAIDTILVDPTGLAKKNKFAGTYSYTAALYGSQKSGTFEVITGKITDVNIFFESVTITDYNSPIARSTILGIYLKILDGNTGIGGAGVRVFYKKGNDTNLLSSNLTSGYGGIVSHTPIIDANTREYYVLIKALGYETKLVKAELKTANESPQEIKLSKGGANLKVKVIDDINAPIKSAVISLKKSDFGATNFEDPLVTDANGRVEFKSLPSGTYSIKGVSLTQEGSINSINLTSDKEVVLTLITGSGNVKFNLLRKGELTNAYCELFEKVNNNTNVSLSSANTTAGYYQATALKAEKEIYLTVPDTNFIYVESPIVKVKRTLQTRDVILYKESDLPNANKVQMFLEGVFESNPWNSAEVKATKLMPGRKYYFLFTLIAKNSTSVNTYANVFVSPLDKNVIDGNTKMFVENAFSTRASIVQTSLGMNSSIIPFDPLTPSNPVHAKQLNVYFGEKQGTLAFPMVVEVSIDVNAIGDTTLFWEGLAGDNNSLLYSKKFTIGQSFCFGAGKCPELLFSNYLKRQGSLDNWAPVGEDYSVLQLGDLYDLNVLVENLTDVSIGDANIFGRIGSNSKTKFLFDGDLNVVSSRVNVPLRGLSSAKFTLDPLTASSSATLVESLERGTELKDYNGNNVSLKFNIVKKEDINIQVIATSSVNTIFSSTEYPLFYIKTFYKSNRNLVKTTWDVKVKGANNSFKTAVTDENGEWLGEMDLSSYPKGTILVFTARDMNNSNPAYLEVTLTEAFSDPTTSTVPDCINVKIRGTDIKTLTTPPVVYASVGSSGEKFTIDSNCADERKIIIVSDLGVSPSNTFIIKPGDPAVEVTLTDPAAVVVSRSGMLGAYPMQIMQVIGRTKFNQVGFIDVVVSDASSMFSISNPILDMRSSNSVNGVITNNQFTGRLDIYYPQMDISTNSVGLTYTKPGIPDTVKFNAVVKSHGIEAITTAYSYGSKTHQWNNKNKCNSKTFPYVPEELIFTDLAQDHADARVTTVTDAIEEALPIVTPDADDRDPTKSLYTLPVPIQEKILSELYPTSGSSSTISTTASTAPLIDKQQKIFFASGDDLYETSGNPMSPATDDVYETIPEMAGDFANSSCEDVASLNYGCNTGNCPNSDTSADDEADLGSNTPDEADEDDTGSSSTCSKCEINYKRVKIDPKSPEGFDGSSCSGVASSGATSDPGLDASVDTSTELDTTNLLGSVTEDVIVGEDNIWTKVVEDVVGRLKVLGVSGCSPCHVLYYGDWLGGMYTKGKKKQWYHDVFGGLFGGGGSVAHLWVQDEYMHAATFFNERVYTWQKELEFKPKEGIPIKLEKYESKIDPRWMNTDEIFTEEDIDNYADRNYLLEELIVTPHGLIPFSATEGGCGESFSAPDPTNTLVEYRNNGLIYAQIPAETVPPGVRLFLKGGYIYAEYIGDDKAQAGNEINFTVTKANLQGSEYAIISVRDWVNGVKIERIFQVKLLANPNNCYSLGGLAGLTGKEFAPRLSFDWDWNGISYNQCESTNPNYTYCDATQFTIGMFKRLELIDNAMRTSNNSALPGYASFYAYLIKDGYSSDFLSDFDYYYSTNAFSSNGFNSTSDSTGYDKFISENKINYNLKSGGTNVSLSSLGGLPMGGLYRIELQTSLTNPAVKSLFNQTATNATIDVTFTLIKQAPNYNLFYETPFDGEVGTRFVGATKVFARKGYGVSLDQGEIPLTDNVNTVLKSRTYTGTPLVPVSYINSSDLAVLMNQNVLTYKNGVNGKSLEFNPMQPTPVVMSIKGTTTQVNPAPREIKAAYNMSGFQASAKTDRSWKLVSSTLGNSGKCTDFLGNQTYSFVENTSGTEKSFVWNNVTKSGTIGLGTVFFTPPTGDTSNSSGFTLLEIAPAYAANVKLYTAANTLFANTARVQLEYFSASNYTKYESLKGMFEMIAEKKLCVSQNAATEMQVWWNQAYLNALLDSVTSTGTNSCD